MSACLHCRKQFPTRRQHASFCSGRCRMAAHRQRQIDKAGSLGRTRLYS